MADNRVALVLGTSTGGVGRHVAALAGGLNGAGWRVAVLGPAATGRKFGFAGRGDVAFRAVEIASGPRPLVALAAARRLRRLTRQADVVHAHGLRAGFVSSVALGRLRTRADPGRPAFVVTLHNAMLGSDIRRWVLRLVMRWLARVADAVLVVSPDLEAQLRSARPDVGRALVSATEQPVGRDTTSTRLALGVPAGRRLILAVGRLHRQKGFDILVEAAALLGAGGRGVTVVIAGDGPERVNLQRAVDAAGVDVRLLGDRADIGDLMCAADVIVMPSRWEGWPLAAAEVLAAGRPFVATRVGGLPELAGDAALLIEPGDPAALAAAVAQILDDSGIADTLATKARKRAAGLPTDDDVTAQLLACYQRVLG